jgi:hypothetical protein
MSMKLSIAAAAIAALFATPVLADPLGIGTSAQGSATYNIALAVANVATANGMDVRPQPYKSTAQATGVVDAGELAFGVDNAVGLRQAYFGEGKFKDNPLKNIRLVAKIVPVRATLTVRKDSDIKTVADLKGKRLPAGFGSVVTGELIVSAVLASAGLTYDDVQKVQIGDFTAMNDAFVDGQIDAIVHLIGTPRDEQTSRDVGGLRPLNVGSDEKAVAAIKEIMPAAHLYLMQPEANITTLPDPTEVLQYDFYVYTKADEPDADVVKLIEAIYNGKAKMAEAVASFAWFEPDQMHGDLDVPFHPAAEAYYKEHGLIH